MVCSFLGSFFLWQILLFLLYKVAYHLFVALFFGIGRVIAQTIICESLIMNIVVVKLVSWIS